MPHATSAVMRRVHDRLPRRSSQGINPQTGKCEADARMSAGINVNVAIENLT